MMSNETFDKIRFAAELILPLGTLISAFLTAWGLPFAEPVMQTFAALNVFFGATVTAARKTWESNGHD
jgi:Na+-driven multidrug efflux pump